MTQHHIAARAHHYVVAILVCVIFGGIAAHLDKERDAKPEPEPVKAAPDAYAKLDADGRRMSGYDEIKK